jgi:hypothetical protein
MSVFDLAPSFSEFVREGTGWIASFAVPGALFNAASHAVLAVLYLFVPNSGRPLWERTVPGRGYEVPGSGLHYLLSYVLPELWSVAQYVLGGRDATKQLLAFQLFVLSGSGAYTQLVLSSPRNFKLQLDQMLAYEWLFVAGLTDSAGLSSTEALKVAIGCKVAGFLWSMLMAAALRALGVARLAKAPPSPEEEDRAR